MIDCLVSSISRVEQSAFSRIFFLSSELAAILPNYDSTFARENIRLEKDVLAKLGVRLSD